MSQTSPKQERLQVAWLSFWAGILMLGLKMGAFVITGSHAILSDAMESVVHIAATGFVVFCVIYSEQPADKDHPYGHGKIENFSVGFEGGLIFIAGLSILWETSRGFFKGYEIQQLEIGMVMIAVSAAINIVLGLFLLRKGKAHKSKILEADGHHILSDAVTSIGVIVGVVLVMITKLHWLDSAIACLVALHLLHTGFKLVKEAVADLMDRVDPEALEQIIETLNEIREDDWYDVHLLRVYKNGPLHHIDFHLVIPGDWSVLRAHEVMDHIEFKILKKLGTGGSVLIHLDPKLDPDLEKKIECKDELLRQPFTVKDATRSVKDRLLDAVRNPH